MKRELRREIESMLYNYCAGNADPAWMLLIAAHLSQMPEEALQLFELRYKRHKSEREICRRMHIEKSTYYSRISEIINDIAVLAAYEQLIQPGEKIL